jgi:hypothetical protein
MQLMWTQADVATTAVWKQIDFGTWVSSFDVMNDEVLPGGKTIYIGIGNTVGGAPANANIVATLLPGEVKTFPNPRPAGYFLQYIYIASSVAAANYRIEGHQG